MMKYLLILVGLASACTPSPTKTVALAGTALVNHQAERVAKLMDRSAFAQSLFRLVLDTEPPREAPDPSSIGSMLGTTMWEAAIGSTVESLDKMLGCGSAAYGGGWQAIAETQLRDSAEVLISRTNPGIEIPIVLRKNAGRWLIVGFSVRSDSAKAQYRRLLSDATSKCARDLLGS